MKLELNEIELSLLSSVLFDNVRKCKCSEGGRRIHNEFQKVKINILRKICIAEGTSLQEIEEFLVSIGEMNSVEVNRTDN